MKLGIFLVIVETNTNKIRIFISEEFPSKWEGQVHKKYHSAYKFNKHNKV